MRAFGYIGTFDPFLSIPALTVRVRDRALFDRAIDSKLTGCDLVSIKKGDLTNGPEIKRRAMVVQRKTKKPVQFERLSTARQSLLDWLDQRGGSIDE
jgi:hypothetical protein